MVGQVDGDSVEAVRDRRAGWAAGGIVRSEHEVVNEKLRASAEKVGQRGAPLIGLEAIPLMNWHPRQFLALPCELVAPPCEFFFRFQQLQARFQPLFACSGLGCRHCAFLLCFFLALTGCLVAMRYIYRGASKGWE